MSDDPLGTPWADGVAIDATFRPRRGRVMATGMAGAVVVVFVGVAVLIPAPAAGGSWSVADRSLLAVLGLAIASLLWRFASIRAVPGGDGIRVRNLVTTRVVRWAEIEAVRFPEGDPWVSLDLVDTEILAVMAVQRADGEYGQQEAQRLATLVVTRRDGLGSRRGPGEA